MISITFERRELFNKHPDTIVEKFEEFIEDELKSVVSSCYYDVSLNSKTIVIYDSITSFQIGFINNDWEGWCMKTLYNDVRVQRIYKYIKKKY